MFGWTTMNFPGNLQPTLLEKYEERRKENELKQLQAYDSCPESGANKKRQSKLVNKGPKIICDFPDREERMKQRMLNRKNFIKKQPHLSRNQMKPINLCKIGKKMI